MLKKNFNKISTLIFFCSLFIIAGSGQVFSQAGVQGAEQQVIRWLSVSGLRSWFSNFGAEGEYFRRDRTTYISNDQIDGLLYPNEYNSRIKGVKVAKGLWIGTTDFADPVANTTYPYKVVCAGPRAVFTGTEIFGDEFSLVGKFNHPVVYVNNANSSARELDDEVDVEDNSLQADRMIYNTFHTSIGASVTRKVLAFAQQYNDNYYIYEYTIKNTGIIDATGVQKLNKPLTGVMVYLQSRLAFPGEAYSGRGAGDWFPSATSWGRNAITDAVGQDGSHTLAAPNDFRAVFSYWGPTTSTVQGGIAEDIGCPGPSATNVWTLAGTQFAGVVVLHADTAPSNPADDKTQPRTTQFVGADNTINAQPSQYNQTLMTQKYTQFMAAGHASATQAEQVGKDANGWPNAYANNFGSDAGGYMAAQGFGPYNLQPGDSIKIVVAEAIGGISRAKGLEVASNWFSNNTSAFVLPKGFKNGGTTTDRNEYKNAWVFSGKDSLFQSFRRALANYNSNYGIPQAPPPPDKFEVTSGGDRIRLSWSNSAESSPHFNGYRLYRAEGRPDTVFDKIQEWDKGNSVTSYDDKTAKRGFNYYYYIQTKDDGTTNPGDPALNIPADEPLVSSKYYTMTSNPASLRRPAGSALTYIVKNESCPKDTVVNADSTESYYFILPMSLSDASGATVRGITVYVNGVRQIPAAFSVNYDTLRFIKTPDVANIEVEIISPVFPLVDAAYQGDGHTKKFPWPDPVEDISGKRVYDIKVLINDTEISPALYTVERDSLEFTSAPNDTDVITVNLTTILQQRKYSLDDIRIVPNPFNLRARNIQFGQTDNTTLDRLAFYNLPPICKIRIYTEVGDLVETIDHNNGSGDDFWQSLTSSRQLVVSGLYIAYFEVTEDYKDEAGNLLYRKGDSVFKKFIIIR